MKEIVLLNSRPAIVDNSDFEWLNQWKWHSMKGYAIRREYLKRFKGKWLFEDIYMHRLVNNTPEGLYTDHINRDKLDNRRSNLRTVNSTQNSQNTALRSDNSSGVKGIWFDKSRNKWCAEIKLNKNKIYLGRFEKKEEAVEIRKIYEDQTFIEGIG